MPIAEVVKLKTFLDAARESAIAVLEDALEQAREGSIAAVAIAVVRPDGAVNNQYSRSENGVLLLGAVSVMHARMERGLAESSGNLNGAA